ncbi:Crp/Fnr family transcriptional regulator [Vreelandella sulfidaeris]|uniref:Crp/Fnr family transcriptional regulator n=1 Tax=Vreelandella sulfidaeris TaxID=115553 RepID=UPI001F4E676A|nr:Crp/Fnr family transcriptional regulator [Halomonas sulfidaeris]
MITPLFSKLSYYMTLSQDEKQLLEAAGTRSILVEKGDVIIDEGERPEHVYLIEKGWACRYKLLENGDNHIMAFLIPGDLCDVHITILEKMDHSIRALTPVTMRKFPADEIRNIMENHPRLARALFWSTLVDEAVLREWLVNMGTRPAEARLAHVFCEMLIRSRIAGCAEDDEMEFPLTQAELSESMGLTQVHINRVLQKLRHEGLLKLEKKRLTILDWDRLKQFSQFDPAYLHCQNVPG